MDLLAAMRIFVRVVERGNFSRAARDLNIGQPAVSDRIERLEKYLGVKLLLRSTRAVSCTDEGSLFYQKSKVVLEAADEARSVIAQASKVISGRIRLAAPHGIGETVLPEIIARIREQHSQLDFDLVLNDEVTDPVTEGVDISLRLGQVGEGNFMARRLGHVRRILVASPAYIEKHGFPEEPMHIAGHAFIRVNGLFNDGQLRFLHPSNPVGPAPVRIVITTSHWRPMYELLLCGAGIGVLQEPVCAEALASGRLVKLLPNYAVPGFDLHALLPVNRPFALKTQVVLKMLETYLPDAMARLQAVTVSET